MVQFGVYFNPILSLKFLEKYHFFIEKKNLLDTRLLLGITHGEIFENMLRLIRFGVYFDRILKIKWLFSYRNNYSIVTRIICFRGSRADVTRENYENLISFGVGLYLIRWCLEKFPKN